MKLLLIQVGDIHIKEANNPASARLRSVAAAIKQLAYPCFEPHDTFA